jgi:hypothetical protein
MAIPSGAEYVRLDGTRRAVEPYERALQARNIAVERHTASSTRAKSARRGAPLGGAAAAKRERDERREMERIRRKRPRTLTGRIATLIGHEP